MLSDQAIRELAIDPLRSFIVKAPAGSGKTEILIKRYLKLLTISRSPEEIIAITFTRKAASEMRERILLALQGAHDKQKPQDPHKLATYKLAVKALENDTKYDWNLLLNPGKIRVMTIDALCQQLIHAIFDKRNSYANITQNADKYYYKASLNCINHAISDVTYQEDIKILLQHLDNKQDELITLLKNLCANREQWLGYLYEVKSLSKETLEANLEFIEQHEIARFLESLPANSNDLLTLLKYIAGKEVDSQSPRNILKTFTTFENIDSAYLRALADFLLTTHHTIRKSITTKQGFNKDFYEKSEFLQIKAKLKEILDELQNYPDFKDALIRVQKIPSPEFEEKQWNVLQALFHILPILIAHLHIVFTENNETDFIEIAQSAIDALGDEQNPTNLALYLDYQINHLLIDEFQDTSIQQFTLLKKLTREWSNDDAKTVFIVGDPMQSIYRFRAAEVGLFLRTAHEGLGAITLTPLELTTNFRSSNTIVNWVNDHFKYIFPEHEDIESGAITFSKSIATKNSDISQILAYETQNEQEQAQEIISLVKELLATKTQSIAILIKARNQLAEIIPLLHKNNITFQGVDIDALANLAHIADTFNLTMLLLNPGNITHWLEFLRSIWCGLTLSDIHKIASFHKDIRFSLNNLVKIPNLSSDGFKRAFKTYRVIENSLKNRYQANIVQWLINTLEELNYDKILNTKELRELNQFFNLLDEFEVAGQISDLTQFKFKLNKLFSQESTPSRLQIMTIHKSKGLEFDHVILPGLSKKPNQPDKKLIRFLKFVTEKNEILLCSPIKAANEYENFLYKYLGMLEKEKEDYELQRLFYVAATRAKESLYLFDCKQDAKTGFRKLLKHQEFKFIGANNIQEDLIYQPPKLKRLKSKYFAISEQSETSPLVNDNIISFPEDILPRIIGVVSHEVLKWICDNHPQTINDVSFNNAVTALQSYGITGSQLDKALNEIKLLIENVFHNKTGQWIIKPHEDEINEYEILINKDQQVQTRIIDRTFKENNIRWIIDFKTGNTDLSLEKYKLQLNEYGHYLCNKYSEEIHLGIYFIQSGQWFAWRYENIENLEQVN